MEALKLDVDFLTSIISSSFPDLYEAAHNPLNRDRISEWFAERVTVKGFRNESGLSELQTLDLLRKLSNQADPTILQLIDFFDPFEEGILSFNHFFILLALLTSIVCSCRTKFICQYGGTIFGWISRGAPIVTLSQCYAFAPIFGLELQEISKAASETNISSITDLTQEDFLLLMFTACGGASIPESQPQPQKRISDPKPKRESESKKFSKSSHICRFM
eukprot:TRINITY_DN18854_c0_g1::TRINITY_DN18854_c0_g1_i1::g.1480::m.1480 TRINITY_DN18854_c0_g1::TRINITY_DN18854_c0_g1_i1::g.1480  ORF type:complete len:219 (+),score=6.42 TRINITY_DN18854_c0_g1_i1:3-659(+)